MRLLRALTLLSASLLATVDARAQDRPALDLRTWRPSTDPNASLVVEPAVTPGPGVFTIGGYAHYAFHPITLRRLGTDEVWQRPLAHSLGFDAIANLGIGQRLAIGAAVPVFVYQDGTSLPATVASPSPISTASSVPTAGFGDIGLSVKGALVRNEQGGFGLGALGYVSLPTGSRTGFSGESGATATARILAEYTLLVAVAQASIGYKFRTEHQTWPDASIGGVRFGDEIPWSVGLAMRPGVFGIDPGNRQRFELAFHGWVPAGPVGPFGSGDPGSAALSPVQMALSDRIELGHYRDTFITVGGELGLTQAVGVPAFRAVVGIGWTPRAHDLDGDGVKDDIDGCPEIPEDKDGFEDSDGCPEIDNDDDGIIDREDACRDVKGVASSDPKKNGCPGPAEPAGPAPDSDGDGIDDAHDRCPKEPEDRDGFEDDDGCPDPDNDGDGIADRDDACPSVRGVASSDPTKNGCPDSDRDGDTFLNDEDKCPDAAEVFNGVTDDDGCPDEGGKPLLTIDKQRKVRLLTAIKLKAGPEVDPSSLPTLRALAVELNKNPEWTLAIGARPAGGGDDAQLEALAKSFALVRTLSSYVKRDGATETVGWDAVKGQPQAESGIGLMILVMPKEPKP